MGPDDYLEWLLDAVEKNNYLDVEGYCKVILNQLHLVDPAKQKELKDYITSLQSAAKTQAKNKEDLINQILEANKGAAKYNLK
ncbi:MAG: hypothetical protein EBS19_16085 [Spirochaetia bacterium]|nr:hypothetical protein [Spirochaetia bacterium]